MDSSDVLQFDCFIDNEIARSATKNFAGMLGKAFEQYKKLWNEYLKLRKHCQDADFKIPFELLESDCYDSKVVTTPNTSQASSKNIPFYKTTSDLNDTVSTSNKSIQREIQEDNLVKSPILIKKRSRSNKSINENCVLSTERLTKLGISTLYNVDTTLLPNGGKLRQSKLVLFPDEQSVNTITHKRYKRSEPLKPHISPTFGENKEYVLRNENKSIEEEIIQNSPDKYMKSISKIESLKMKKRNLTKFRKPTDIKENNIPNKLSNENNNTEFAIKGSNQPSLSQYFPPVCTSTQNDQPFLIKKSKTFSYSSETIENNGNILNFPVSPELAEIQYSLFETGDNLSTPPKLVIAENSTEAEQEKYSRSTNQMLHTNSSECNDETFYALGEQLKKELISKTDETKNKTSQKFAFAKKNLLNNFDIPPKKENVHFDKPSKKMSERAKMTGVTCWECKKYYANLGLSTQEIKARQNQCSRHRTRNDEETPSSPEGFWNPLFPDTYSSTYQE